MMMMMMILIKPVLASSASMSRVIQYVTKFMHIRVLCIVKLCKVLI